MVVALFRCGNVDGVEVPWRVTAPSRFTMEMDKLEYCYIDWRHLSDIALHGSWTDKGDFVHGVGVGAEMHLRLRSVSFSILILSAHAWSGIVDVEVSGQPTQRLNLYSSTMRAFPIAIVASGTASDVNVRLLVVGKGSESQGCEAIVNGLVLKRSELNSIASDDYRNCGETIPVMRSSYHDVVCGREGEFITHLNDQGVCKTLREQGVWAADDLRVFRQLLRIGDCVFDIGGHIGHHSVVFSRLVGEEGRVFTFEPQRELKRLLAANLALNERTNVEVFQCAVGETDGDVRMWPLSYEKPNNFGALGIAKYAGEFPYKETERSHVPAPALIMGEIVQSAELGELVPLLRLDTFMDRNRHRIPSVSFLKIDVQAYELYVLQGAIETLRAHKPALFVEISPHWMDVTGYDYREVYGLLKELGYRFFEWDGTRIVEQTEVRYSTGDRLDDWDILAFHPENHEMLTRIT